MKTESRNYFKAYENVFLTTRVVVNYEVCEHHEGGSSYEYVNRVFISFGDDSVIVDMWNFDLMGSDGVTRDKIGTQNILVEKLERDGFSEINFVGETKDVRFAIKFGSRDKSFRIVENTFDEKTASGVMHNQLKIKLPDLDFIQGVG
jgi:hypothetical protein